MVSRPLRARSIVLLLRCPVIAYKLGQPNDKPHRRARGSAGGAPWPLRLSLLWSSDHPLLSLVLAGRTEMGLLAEGVIDEVGEARVVTCQVGLQGGVEPI